MTGRGPRGWAAALALSLLASLPSACVFAQRPPDGDQSPSPVSSVADRPTAGGEVVRRCGSHYAEAFDAGLETRTVGTGVVSLVTFRAAPAGTVDAFKVMVRLAAGSQARLESITPGTTLLYDRARFSGGNTYRLSDGERSVQFIGCPDHPAVFNGAVLTAGPTAVDLRVHTQSTASSIRITAYAD